MSKVNSRLAKKVTKEVILSSRLYVDGLIELLSEDLAADVKLMKDRTVYNTTNFTELVADHFATQRTLERVIELITIRNEKDD